MVHFSFNWFARLHSIPSVLLCDTKATCMRPRHGSQSRGCKFWMVGGTKKKMMMMMMVQRVQLPPLLWRAMTRSGSSSSSSSASSLTTMSMVGFLRSLPVTRRTIVRTRTTTTMVHPLCGCRSFVGTTTTTTTTASSCSSRTANVLLSSQVVPSHLIQQCTGSIRWLSSSSTMFEKSSRTNNDNNDDNDDQQQDYSEEKEKKTRTRTTTTNTSTTTTKSWNRRFREIEIHPAILQHIQNIRIGIAPRTNRHSSSRDGRGSGSSSSLTTNQFDPNNRMEQQQQQSKGIGDPRIRKVVGGGTPQPQTVPYNVDQQQQQYKLSENPFEPPRPFGRFSFPVRIVGELNKPSTELALFHDSVPQSRIPQVAICGRSNVGKSTLLNVLLYSNLAQEQERRRWDANNNNITTTTKKKKKRRKIKTFLLPKGIKAVTSDKPGETRKITFYQLGSPHPILGKKMDLRMLLVDLPGYGFAFAHANAKRNFQNMIRRYLTGDLPNQDKNMLKRILLLIDARHGMMSADLEFLEMIQTTIVAQTATATKTKNKDNVLRALAQQQQEEEQEQEEHDDNDLLMDFEEVEEDEKGEYLDQYNKKQDEEDEENDIDEDDEEDSEPEEDEEDEENDNDEYYDKDDEEDSEPEEDEEEEEEDEDMPQRIKTLLPPPPRSKNARKLLRKQQQQKAMQKYFHLPPIQIVLTKCDLVTQADLARRVVQVREQLSNALIRESKHNNKKETLPVMLVSARTNNGILELQKHLATLAGPIDPIAPSTPNRKWHFKQPNLVQQQQQDDNNNNKKKNNNEKKKKKKPIRAAAPPLWNPPRKQSRR